MSLAEEYGMRPEKKGARKAKRVNPPQAPEAEQAAIGCCLLEPGTRIDEAREFGADADWFSDLRLATAWNCMLAMQRDNKGIDVITVARELHEAYGFEEAVSEIATGLAQLQQQTPSAANLPAYLETLKEKWMVRQVARTGDELAGGARSIVEGEKTDVYTLVARAEKEILRLGEEGQRTQERVIKEILREVVADMENYHRGHARIRGIPSGLAYFDKLTGGIGGKNGFQWVLAGRPGMGKTSLALQWAEHAALDYVWFDPVLEKDAKTGKLRPIIDNAGTDNEKIRCERRVGVPVGIFSLEMTAESLAERMAFSRARADMQRWRTGFAEKADLAPLTVSIGELAKGKIFIEDRGRSTIETVKAKARRMARQHGIKLFVLDYLQLMSSGEKRFRPDRVQELMEISGELFALGKELKVPWLILAQMNRDVEKDPNRLPRLSDLKDCGAIEQDADWVGFLHKPKLRGAKEEQWDEVRTRLFGDDWSKAPMRVNLLSAKFRHGPSDKEAELLFQGSSTRYMDYVEWLKETGQMQPALGERKVSEEAWK